jgi:hypothetical protein
VIRYVRTYLMACVVILVGCAVAARLIDDWTKRATIERNK